MKANASESQGQALQNKKTTTRYTSFEELGNTQEKVWKVEKKVEGGHSVLMRLWINGEPTNQTCWGWKQNYADIEVRDNVLGKTIKNTFKGIFVPLQTKQTKFGQKVSRL